MTSTKKAKVKKEGETSDFELFGSHSLLTPIVDTDNSMVNDSKKQRIYYMKDLLVLGDQC